MMKSTTQLKSSHDEISHFVSKDLLFNISEAKKLKGDYCCAVACKNIPAKKKGGLCSKHYHRYRKIIDPVYDRYANFKRNAIKRHKDFTITLEEFRDFCTRTGYIICKGKRGRNCTIDRIKNQHGYHIWNIQIKSNVANIKKYHGVDKHFTELPEDDEDYLPF